MKKHTIELARRLKHIKGYGVWENPINGQRFPTHEIEVLNRIVEWSNGKSVTIYKHLVRSEEENISTTEFHTVKCGVPADGMQIPLCDLVYYLDIYYQDK